MWFLPNELNDSSVHSNSTVLKVNCKHFAWKRQRLHNVKKKRGFCTLKLLIRCRLRKLLSFKFKWEGRIKGLYSKVKTHSKYFPGSRPGPYTRNWQHVPNRFQNYYELLITVCPLFFTFWMEISIIVTLCLSYSILVVWGLRRQATGLYSSQVSAGVKLFSDWT